MVFPNRNNLSTTKPSSFSRFIDILPSFFIVLEVRNERSRKERRKVNRRFWEQHGTLVRGFQPALTHSVTRSNGPTGHAVPGQTQRTVRQQVFLWS